METVQPTHTSAKTYVKRAVWLVVLAGIARFVSYSIEQYNKAGAAEGIVVCDETNCLLTLHIHADIEFDLCGQSPTLPREHGALDALHTHKEKNYLHFHDRVALDTAKYKETGEKVWQYEKSLSVQEVIDVFALSPMNYCQTDEVEITVLNNELPVAEGLQYNWRDGDNLKLIYTKK